MKDFDKTPVKEELDEQGKVVFVGLEDKETYTLSVEEDYAAEEKREKGSYYNII